jgi:glycosyltransferase involved in cell wall biosynthesis
MMEALRDDHDLTLLSWQPLEVAEVNRFYGTSLRATDVHNEVVPAALRGVADRVPLPLSLFKSSVLMRLARSRVDRFDLALTVNNEADLGRPGIQYVHYPCYVRPRPDVDVRWYHGAAPVLDAYYLLADTLAGMSPERMRRNLTLVNSAWTGSAFTARHGVPARTLYPPVTATFPEVPWERRENSFLCVGRIAPEKDLHRVMDIVAAVRHTHPEVRLCLVGTPGRGRYYRGVMRRARAEAAWVTVREDLARDDLVRLIPRFRYGIHGMAQEHFGMAPAEMVAAGCVVFVPRGGGQQEIVGDHPRLTYATVEEAVGTITRVLAHEEEQQALRDFLADRRHLFSTELFMQETRRIVAGVLSGAGVNWPR